MYVKWRLTGQKVNKLERKVLVVGNFDILHPGHIRLLKFARECGDYLQVAVNSDQTLAIDSYVAETHRLEMVQSIDCVDNAFITSSSVVDLITELKPFAVVKGKEFEELENIEKKALEEYGGKLIFGSGELGIPSQIIEKKEAATDFFDFSALHSFAERHAVCKEDLASLINQVQQFNVAVIGEIIVDEYVQGTAVGLSQEDPTIVMTPYRKDVFLGGAAITAGHIKSLGANSVALFSVIGDDDAAKYCESNIDHYSVEPYIFIDQSRPTPQKTRYRADQKTLLRVNQVRQHKISRELQDDLFNQISLKIANLDLLVFSDFNYGVLPQDLVNRLIKLCRDNSVIVVADSQTSSQVGDIARYKGVDLITPTENEVRVSLNNPDDGLVILAKKLCDISSPEHLAITLGSEGVFIHAKGSKDSTWENDQIPAINKKPVDPAGAGDCFLATSSLCLLAGANVWQSFYLGSLAAACQVATMGNIPLEKSVLLNAMEASFK